MNFSKLFLKDYSVGNTLLKICLIDKFIQKVPLSRGLRNFFVRSKNCVQKLEISCTDFINLLIKALFVKIQQAKF